MAVIERVPDVVFKTRVRDESVGGSNPYRWQDKTTQGISSVARRWWCSPCPVLSPHLLL
jgi:peroxiredoxin